MEENNNMTAERSLEIITEQIERNRKEVTRDTGLTLYVSGLCVMGVALFIGICAYFTCFMQRYPSLSTLPTAMPRGISPKFQPVL